MNPPAGDAAIQKLLAWRELGVKTIIAVALVLLAQFATAQVALPLVSEGLGLALGVGSAALVVIAALVWYHLYRCAQEHGGRGYAIGHVGLSIALTPLLYLGVLLIPLLVESDIRKGSADWRKRHGRSWPVALVSVASGCLALFAGATVMSVVGAAGGGLLGLLAGGLGALLALGALNHVVGSLEARGRGGDRV